MSDDQFKRLFGDRNDTYFFYNPGAPASSMLISGFYIIGMSVTIDVVGALFFGNRLEEVLIVREPYFWLPTLIGLGLAGWFYEKFQFFRFKKIGEAANDRSDSLSSPATETKGSLS
jgi:hypothetical protein